MKHEITFLLIFLCLVYASRPLAETRIINIDNNNNLILNGDFIQGGLIRGKSFPNASIKFLNKSIYQDKENRFILGFGRDFSEVAVIEIYFKKKLIKKKLRVKKQNYKIQRIDGLPKKMVTPPETVYKRIVRENKEIARVRSIKTKKSFIFQDFLWPTKGIITGVFGSQRILNGKPRRPHYGIDIAAKTGTKVIAPTDCIVRLAEDDLYFTGGTVMLDHGHGVTSVYSHLSKIFVKINERIDKGKIIGLVGSTGRSTGPHLDWRINWFNQRLDPALFVKSKIEND